MTRTKSPLATATSPASAYATATMLAAALLVLALPLVWDTGVLEAFRGPKRDLALFAWTALAGLFIASNAGGTALRDAWWAPWAGLVLGGLLSAPLSGEPLRVVAAVAPAALAALGWGALRQLDEGRRRRLLNWVVISGVVQALVAAAFTSETWRPASFDLLRNLWQRYAWIGTIGNPADLAVFLTLPTLLALSLAIARKERRIWHAIACAIMTAVIVASATLTAVAALAVGASLVLWRLVPRGRRLAVSAALAVALLAVGFFTPLRGRVLSSISEARHGGWIFAASGRGAGLAAATGMVAAHPLTGVGYGLFEARSFRFQSEEILAQRARNLGVEIGFGEAHNDFLQHVAETGLLGLALLVAGAAVPLAKRSRRDDLLPVVGPLLAAGAVLAAAQFPLHLAAIAAQWVVLAALALPPLAVPEPASRGLRVATACAAVILVVAVATVAARRHSAAQAFEQGKLLVEALNRAPDSPARREASGKAVERLEPRLSSLPHSAEARLVTGNLAMIARRPTTALAHFSRALELGERPETRFDVGMALIASGDRQAGMTHLIRAIKLNPKMLERVTDEQLARALRRRLDADGYGTRYPWIYRGTRAETP